MTRTEIADRVFLALETASTPQHVAFLATFALPGDADPRHHVHRLLTRLRAAPVAAPFTFRLRHPGRRAFAAAWDVLDEQDVDRSHHVRRSALPTPGGASELHDLVSQLHSRPLDLTRPLWECHLIEGLAHDRYALYFKVHHALIDGLGAVQRLRYMLSADPLDDGVRALWSVAATDGAEPGGAEPGGAEPGGGGATPLARMLAGIGATMATGAAAGRAARKMAEGALAPDDPARAVPFAIPRSRVNGAVGQQRRVATRHYDFQRFRTAAHAAGVTVNDVLLSVCGGALRRCLAEAGTLPERSLTAGTPVSTRAAGDTETANAFAMTVMSLGTDVADPLERLRLVSRSSGIAKKELGELPPDAAGLYGALFTWPFVAQNVLGLGGRTRPPYNIVVSNVPGSPKQQYFAGSALESIHPLGSVCHGVRLFVAACSSSGRLNLGFVGDRDALPFLDDLAEYASDELGLLERALDLGRAELAPAEKDQVDS
ncbi:wax ester/triacylglycerol synthase family O-acyltransferase [Streptomyces sp. CB03238]|uniref:wax ester/triacylglycerol synthase family O-acyltransferase n=1 Tax=Streptomyces sp. CB03238 TaxID=1907777 RepID=UPI0015C40E29|nr:wax ester/triacylglycerol synthase family O-acyltransferase [Streptomyces sp. CB03238]